LTKLYCQGRRHHWNAFSLEGFAFLTEAIFLGVFLFGWNKLPPLWHWLSGVLVAVGGIPRAFSS
jgi:cytochrome bd-type quinol oxidase subunit 1